MEGADNETQPGFVDLGIAGLDHTQHIGSGGAADVYRSEQTRLGRTVAVKVLRASNAKNNTERFERETLTLGKLSNHPGIVTLHEAGVTPTGRPFLIMAFCAGGSLADRLEQGPLRWQEVVRIAGHVSAVVGEAHEAGVLHRDLKPANILIDEHDQLLIADFGIATLSNTGTFSAAADFTPGFAPPETLLGEPSTAAGDVYSIGALAQSLLTGRAPFESDVSEANNPLAWMRRIENDPPPDLRPLGVPDNIASLIESALAKDPNERPTIGQLVSGFVLEGEAKPASVGPATMSLSAITLPMKPDSIQVPGLHTGHGGNMGADTETDGDGGQAGNRPLKRGAWLALVGVIALVMAAVAGVALGVGRTSNNAAPESTAGVGSTARTTTSSTTIGTGTSSDIISDKATVVEGSTSTVAEGSPSTSGIGRDELVGTYSSNATGLVEANGPRQSPDVLWSNPIGASTPFLRSMTVIDDIIYGFNLSSELVAVDVHTGTLLWSRSYDAQVFNQRLAFRGDELVVWSSSNNANGARIPDFVELLDARTGDARSFPGDVGPIAEELAITALAYSDGWILHGADPSGDIFSGKDAIGVVAFDAEGRTTWTATMGLGTGDMIAVGGDVLVVPTFGTITAFDLDDGSIRWTDDIAGQLPTVNTTIVSGEYLVTQESSGTIVRDVATGAVVTNVFSSAQRPLVLGDRLVVAGLADEIKMVDLVGGEVIWSQTVSTVGSVPALISDGATIFVMIDAEDERTVAAMDVESGEVLWRTTFGGNLALVQYGGPASFALSGDRLVLGAQPLTVVE